MSSFSTAGFLEYVENLPKSRLVLSGITFVLLVVLVDFLSSPVVSLAIFYLIPIAILTWFVSRKAGVLLSLLCITAWLAVELAVRSPAYANPITLVWNALVRFTIFLIVLYLIDALKLLQRQKAEYRERLVVEEAVRRNEERYRSLVENMSEGYHVADENGRFTYCSPNISIKSGFANKDLIGHPYTILIADADKRRVVATYLQAVRQGVGDVVCEFRVRPKHGDLFWIEQSTRVVRDAGGSVVEFRSVVRDATQRKIFEDQIRLLAKAVEDTSEMISITDLDNRFVFVNKSFKEFYGYTEEEILGKDPGFLQPPGRQPDLLNEIYVRTRSGGWLGELVNVKKDGSRFPIMLSTSRIEGGEGRILGLIGVARDISDQKKAEEALRQAEDRFEHLFTDIRDGINEAGREIQESGDSLDVRMRGLALKINDVTEKMRHQIQQVISFSTLAAHELRTPVTIIRHQLENVFDAGTPLKDLRKTLFSVYDETLRLTRTIEQFLTIGTLQSGTIQLKFRKLAFRELLKNFYDEALLLSRKKNVSVVLAMGPDVTICGDEDQLRQMLFNLFDNALKHTPSGGRIGLASSVRDETIYVEFSDSGSGIPRELLPRIFDPFFRAPSEGVAIRGAGLGLTYVKWIVHAHKGSISVQSEIGKGTTFLIQFPAIIPDTPADQQSLAFQENS